MSTIRSLPGGALAAFRKAWRRLFVERVALAVAADLSTLLDKRQQLSLDALARQLGEAIDAAIDRCRNELVGQLGAELRSIPSTPADPPAVADASSLRKTRMVSERPSRQNVIDLFDGEWSSKLPASSSLNSGGRSDLFSDERVSWFDRHLGPLKDLSVLELGPLEGGHSYSMHELNARSITAIEANSQAFLRLLCIKELFGLDRLHPLLGNFMPFLAESSDERYDLVVASGVLYHMTDPLLLLDLICNVTDRVFLWTHYYDPVVVAGRVDATLFDAPTAQTRDGFSCVGCRRNYPDAALAWSGFSGGSNEYAIWLTRDGILGFLRARGMSRIDIGFDHETHPNGPAFAISARRQ